MRRSFIWLVILALLLSLLTTTMALAYHADAPDPHQQFGFEASAAFESDYCLRCHDIHAAAGDNTLIRARTITATCASCHGVYQASPRNLHNPDYSGQEAGLASSKGAYKVSIGQRDSHEGHRLVQGISTAASYTYASGPDGRGESSPFTTASADFIPGSGYPALAAYTYLNRIDRWLSLVAGTDMSAFIVSERQSPGGLYCGSCHSVHGDIKGTALPPGITGNKLLAARPNHRTESLDTRGWNEWSSGGWRFCAACHQQRTRIQNTSKQETHNHPPEFCLECHADNPVTAADFPHTGGPNLLAEYPDQLCTAACHAFDLP